MTKHVASTICAALAAHFCCVLALAAVPVDALAAVPVEESVEENGRSGDREPATRTTAASNRRPGVSLDIPPTIEPGRNSDFGASTPAAPAPGSAPAGAGSAGLADLFYQVQVLQQEVQDLRGLVEEQDHQIKRLQRDQKEQYLDLDRRVVALSENRPSPGPSASPTQGESPAAGGASLSEREAYRVAFDAMRNREFETSMRSFEQLIQNYPNGQYTPNAFYWMGEIYLVANQDAEQARQSFMQVINLYPDHQKTPDALYKLGVVYHTLGDLDSARRYLNQVQRDYPDSSAAGLARKYAAEMR